MQLEAHNNLVSSAYAVKTVVAVEKQQTKPKCSRRGWACVNKAGADDGLGLHYI